MQQSIHPSTSCMLTSTLDQTLCVYTQRRAWQLQHMHILGYTLCRPSLGLSYRPFIAAPRSPGRVGSASQVAAEASLSCAAPTVPLHPGVLEVSYAGEHLARARRRQRPSPPAAHGQHRPAERARAPRPGHAHGRHASSSRRRARMRPRRRSAQPSAGAPASQSASDTGTGSQPRRSSRRCLKAVGPVGLARRACPGSRQ